MSNIHLITLLDLHITLATAYNVTQQLKTQLKMFYKLTMLQNMSFAIGEK